MHFDDRLQTLLDAPVANARDRAVRWRQLVDLLARGGASKSAIHLAAIELVRRDSFAIDEEVRAATLRAIAGGNVPAALLRVLAAQPLRIAAALFAGLTLNEENAAYILDDADPEVRALVRTESAPEPQSKPELALAGSGPALPEPSIGEMVSRIERLQQRRAPAQLPASPKAPEAPAPQPRRSGSAKAKEARLFEWESDASGHIAWVDGAPRGIFVGRPLSSNGGGMLDRDVSAKLVRHHPFADAPVVLDGLFAGTWQASGRPAFDPATGRFIGYRGMARRTDETGLRPETKKREPDLDALREMVHEIKTPLNAIIGFAEIIDGQYLGPAHRLYRERAASIVAQARQLLAAVEDLDFAAKVRADAGSSERHSGSLSDLIRPIAAEMEQCLAVYGGVLELDASHGGDVCSVSPELAERLLRRLLLSLCKVVAPGEVLRVASSRRGATCLLTIARPRLLDGYNEAQLVDPVFDPSGGDAAQSVGLGFALRLVRGLARVGGGSLIFDEHRITVELPARDG